MNIEETRQIVLAWVRELDKEALDLIVEEYGLIGEESEKE